MTDRDHFAAAALSGLIAANDSNTDMDEMIASSWAWADAMLATLATSAESSVVRDEYRGVGGTHVRVMWAVFSDKSADPQYESLCRSSCLEWADKAKRRSDEVLTIEPLYRKLQAC